MISERTKALHERYIASGQKRTAKALEEAERAKRRQIIIEHRRASYGLDTVVKGSRLASSSTPSREPGQVNLLPKSGDRVGAGEPAAPKRRGRPPKKRN